MLRVIVTYIVGVIPKNVSQLMRPDRPFTATRWWHQCINQVTQGQMNFIWDCLCLQVIGGRERWICRGAEAENRTAAARETQSPGGEPDDTSTSILPVWTNYPTYCLFRKNTLHSQTQLVVKTMFCFITNRKSKDDTWVSNNTYWELRKDPGFSNLDCPVLW